MATRVVIDPITRIEGHLKIEVEVANGKVTNAWSSGTMARGAEKMLAGRDPRDAVYVTERMCGVCFGSHAWASAVAVERAQGTTELPELARILRNLIVGACWLHDKPLHFYHLAALDYLDITVLTRYNGRDPYILKLKELIINNQAGPLLPRYEPDEWSINDLELVVHAVKSYLQALIMQAKAKKMSALFSGKQPHQASIVAGGVTYLPTKAQINEFEKLLLEQRLFITKTYVADVLLIGAGPLLRLAQSKLGVGYQNYLSYGGFPMAAEPRDTDYVLWPGAIVNDAVAETNPAAIEAKVSEDAKYAWYLDSCGGHPYKESQIFDLDKPGAYSFIKAPRWAGNPMEVGPLARMMVNVKRRNPHPAVATFKGLLAAGVQPGAVARHAARALEALMILDAMTIWLTQLKAALGLGSTVLGEELENSLISDLTKSIIPGGLTKNPVIHDTKHWNPPYSGRGYGLVEAPRGALGHWCIIKDHKIDNYSMVVPTTWNGSPRDSAGKRGPIEQALIGTPVPDVDNPNNIVRVVRSFDPCIACAVHLIHPTTNQIKRFVIQ